MEGEFINFIFLFFFIVINSGKVYFLLEMDIKFLFVFFNLDMLFLFFVLWIDNISVIFLFIFLKIDKLSIFLFILEFLVLVIWNLFDDLIELDLEEFDFVDIYKKVN